MTPRLMSPLPLAVLALTGCYKITYTTGGPASMAAPSHSEWHHRLLFGIVELDPVAVNQVCPGGGFTQAHTEVSVTNSLAMAGLSFCTAGISAPIYNPSTIQIWCASGAYYEGTLNESGEVVQLLVPEGEPLSAEVEAARIAYTQRVVLGG